MRATMRSRVRPLWRTFVYVTVLLAAVTNASGASFRVSDIRVEGLQRIAAGTVFNYLPVQIGDTTTDDVTARIIRTLYGTGFFDDVSVERDGTVLVISVRERPAVAEINISGNKDIETKQLKESLTGWGRT